jgi:neopullulanase
MTELLTDQLFLYREQSNSAMLNVLDSHDTARIKTVAGEDEDKALQALAFTFMQTGSPCIYYGTEMGMSGDNDPDCRKPMDWSQAGSPVWQAVQAIIAFRRQHWESLSKGQTWLEVEESGLIHVKRTGKETIEGWFNTTGQAVSLSAEATLSRGYEAGQLASKGYVLSVK